MILPKGKQAGEVKNKGKMFDDSDEEEDIFAKAPPKK